MAAKMISTDINPLVMSFTKWAELKDILGDGCAEAISRVAMCIVSQATQDMHQQPEARAACGHDGCSGKIRHDMACVAVMMASSFMAAQLYYAMEHGKNGDEPLYSQALQARLNSVVRLLIDRENWVAGHEAVDVAEQGLTNLLRKMPRDMLRSIVDGVDAGTDDLAARLIGGPRSREMTLRVMRKVLAEGGE